MEQIEYRVRHEKFGFGQVSKRYMSRNSECRSIVNIISTALAAEPELDCNTSAQDWSPTEKCPFCDGLRVSTDDSPEKDSIRMEPENEGTASDGEYYGAGCSNQARPEQNTTNSSPESIGYIESSGSSQTRPSYMHPFSNLCTPPVLPVMTPFVPLPEIANQLFCQSLLQWSTSNLLLQQIGSQRSSENLHNPISEQYLLASKSNTLIHGKENSDSETNHLIQQMIPSVSAKLDDVRRAVHMCANSDLSALYGGLSKSSFNNESLMEQSKAIYKEGSNDNEEIEEDQPLDLSSRRALQAATQCAVSSAHNSRDSRRLRASINMISDKSSDHPSKDEENNSAVGHAKNVALARTIHPSMNKRNYSQADLDAAVRDIRCGRLGTRRASVVYGIPRSTLRNKIYKLDAAEDQRTNGTSGKKRRMNSFGTAMTPNNDKSPPAATVPFQNDANSRSTEIIIPPTQALLTIDGVPLPELIQEIGPKNKPHYTNQEPINGKDEPIAENKKSLWSPFARQQLPESKKVHTEEKKTDESPVNSTENQSDWKKSRPKRGQYRKYKKDALDEAVRSVRRGEMSVHRAGSFYGVPHSTLEYKVKERNLTRTKCKKAAAENIFEKADSGLHANANNPEGSSPKNSPQQASSANPAVNDVSTTSAMKSVSVVSSATSAVPS
uniref:HTH psq-type domain-containing protein n=1 Tax=Setaria digitata TaxID=48799 RepID=A0A915Q894_9BILA